MSENSSRRWSIASYERGNEEAICALMRVGSAQDLEAQEQLRLWRWRFLDAPVTEVLIDLAWDGKKLAGQYAVQPIRMQVSGRPVLWAISLDTVTHPDYRRQGMFSALANHLYARIRDRVEVVFGFPNDQSSRGFYQKLGWASIEPHPRMVSIGAVPDRFRTKNATTRALTPAVDLPLALIHRSLTLPGRIARRPLGLSARVVDSAPADVGELWAVVAAQPGIRVTMDKPYLEWRFDRHPLFQYRYIELRRRADLVGLAVIRPPQGQERQRRFGHIMDILLSDPDDWSQIVALLSAAIHELHRCDGRIIWAFAPVQSRLRRISRGVGFVPSREATESWRWTLGARVIGNSSVPENEYDALHWHIGPATDDVI